MRQAYNKTGKRYSLCIFLILLFFSVPGAIAGSNIDRATPIITVSNTTGSISSCLGSASASPNIEQFSVSGSNLAGDITAAASVGFEISLNPNSGYAAGLTITATGGAVSNQVVYVRASATTTSGNLTGFVLLSSPGAKNKNASVNGVVHSIPTVNGVMSQGVNNGANTMSITFGGTATTYSWVNDTPGIGLAASGTGDIPSFTAINTGSTAIVAKITVTPSIIGTGCTGTPVSFTITVNSTVPPGINTSGSPGPLSTIYGTPSTSTIISVSGVNLSAGILVTPPAGFEVSTDDINFSPTVTVGSGGTIASTNVYIRLAATTPVGNNYSGNIQLSSAGVPVSQIFMPLSSVTQALLTIIADDKTRTFGAANPVLTASYVGFVNFETAASLAVQPVLTTTAVITSPIGQYPISAGGAASPNYTITYLPGILTILPSEQSLVVPNAFTPNGDGVNDTWNIQYLNLYGNCSVNVFTRWGQNVYSSLGYGAPWDGTYKGAVLPSGTYYYVINFKNGLSPLSGYVAIIR
ncbi:MAG TPA: gliding motility-associated C-terminal domain-containing protein [Mucilaginibacter sp.]|jgi:gliding motility-associated-like protein|nr:gliding motility-associated C-terminal domain-containing protein [Mucilaginibacter sp.]